MTTIDVESTRLFADALVELLVDEGPMAAAEICGRLGWTRGRFDAALRHARVELCPSLGVTIPHPTPADSWRYRVTDSWREVEIGASHALGQVDARLASILRDVDVIFPQLEKGTKEWRRASFLRKHLKHITSTLKEINGEG
jgi:hypothetical protein